MEWKPITNLKLSVMNPSIQDIANGCSDGLLVDWVLALGYPIERIGFRSKKQICQIIFELTKEIKWN